MYQTRTCTNRGCSESQCVYEPACECTSHAYSACYDNDRYWYDSCGTREEKREECGSDSCGSWYTCSECWNARYEKECQDCVDRGCLSDACFANNYQNTRQGTDCGTDTCSDSGSSWYIKEYVDDNEGCSGGSCGSDTRNWDFCSGDVVHDRTCSGSDLGADLTHNCNVDDGWYCNVDVRENRDYSCSDGACVYSVSTSEDCSTKASTDSDAGNVPLASGTCTDYTGCSNGACSTTPYPDTCISGTQLREHYNSGSFCTFEIYDCSDFEAAATGDTSDDPTTTGTCTAGTGATCSSGAFSTASGSSGTEGCIDPNACPGGANCVFREYYAIDSTDACPGLDTCVSKTYDPDTNPNTCQACLGSGRYDIGGIANCCGDDNSEHKLTRVCQDGVGWSVCATSPSDDACCDQTSDCVWDNACYNNGADHPGVAGAKCDNGIWKDKTSPITTITVSGTEGWNSWYTSDVQITFSCSDTGGSGCDVTMYCVDTTNTCSPSITYSSPFTVSNEGVNYVRYFSRDNAGNQETLQLMQVKIDKTDPIFNSYSVSGCDYKDIDNKICWAGPGTATIHDIQHTDSVSTPYVQYLAFTNNCNPNNCGCGWDQLCVSGDEIKSSVETDTGILTSHMWNDDYINIQSASCVGSCTGASVDEQWSVVTGSNPKDYRIYAFLYDEAGRATGYSPTGWEQRTDSAPPVSSVSELPPYTEGGTIDLYWGGSDGGSGIDCYTIQFQYNDTESLSGWQDFLACTTQTFETFNAFEEAGSPPDGIGNYTFYFRSLAKDLVGNTETKTTADTQTIIFIPELAETYVVDEFDNSVPNNGKTAASRMVSIIIINKTEDHLDMTINYSTHSPASEPSTWSTTRCQNAYTCAVTLGPFKNDTKVDYYTYVYDSSTGKSERNPPESYYSFTMYEHPIANFMTNILMPTIGRSDLIDIKVRNIHLKADAVHLKLEPDNVIFSENGQQEIDIYMNPQEEKTIYAKILFSDNLRYDITLAASSSIDSDLTDKDSLWVTVIYAPDFPGLSNFAVVLLLIMAVLIYAKFVRFEN